MSAADPDVTGPLDHQHRIEVIIPRNEREDLRFDRVLAEVRRVHLLAHANDLVQPPGRSGIEAFQFRAHRDRPREPRAERLLDGGVRGLRFRCPVNGADVSDMPHATLHPDDDPAAAHESR